MASAPMNKIERAHQMYRDGGYEEALRFYTEALGMAKTKPQKIALHSNRAACYLKLHDFKQAAEECTWVLELDQKHTGALMLRAQTLVTLKEYHSALFDVNRLMELNPSSEVYQNLHARLKTQLSLAPIPEAEAELEEEEEEEEEEDDEAEPKRAEEEKELEKREDQEIELEKSEDQEKNVIDSSVTVERDQKAEFKRTIPNNAPQTLSGKESSEQNSKGWQAIPKPKGHSHLDYSRWDRVEDDSSEEDDDEDDEESQPQYRFRLKTVGVRPVN
ncbi:uncharacterized protein LOC132312352 [Cornus florida]|uniref:uncharacterized protein LOC132312352 n=1 Tax=Cornus florida TaxID=4283 RepID=UPI0028A0CC36|nr:uncharacterized protein LOC132312352 [Cornus florida]